MEIGKTQKLKVLRVTTIGAYLGEDDPEKAVLLPKKQVPEGADVGTELFVFLYRDSEDRLIATTNRPYAEVGHFAYLSVRSVSKVGAFLDWGLEKDLLVPFQEQEERLSKGQNVMVYLYLDKSGRIAATTKIYDHLQPVDKKTYRQEDEFAGVIYRTVKEFGAFTAVLEKGKSLQCGSSYEKLFFGLIPPSQVFKTYRLGEMVNGRIVRIRQDGKLDLSVRKRVSEQLDADSETVLRKLDEYDGVLPFSEDASPSLIMRELGMSKSGFKRALGHLYKARKIVIAPDEIRILRKAPRDSE